MTVALKETLASKRQGKDIWFRFQTEIGPCCTADVKERALFGSDADAMLTQAWQNPMTFFEPTEVDEADGGDFDWNKPAPTSAAGR